MLDHSDIVDEYLIIEGFRVLVNEEDKNEDLPLTDDVLKIFYQVGNNFFDNIETITLDLKDTSTAGVAIITIFSIIDNLDDVKALGRFPKTTFNLESFRPSPDGEAKCQVFKIPKSATVLKGFSPSLSGFNGENGLIRSIFLYQCTDKIVDMESKNCDAYLYDCSKVLFSWYPGTVGEVLSNDVLVNTNTVMLEILYNSGTGWLTDSSGVKVYYSSSVPDLSNVADKVIITNKTEAKCDARILSVSLHSINENVDNIKLKLNGQDCGKEDLISGYLPEYQPTRHLGTPKDIFTNEILTLECSSEDCFAIVTFMNLNALDQKTCLKRGNYLLFILFHFLYQIFLSLRIAFFFI